MDSSLICPTCQNILTPDMLFCPKCGAKIQEALVTLTLGKQLGIYALSVFLPPLGLWPGIKYLRSKDEKVRIVGIIAIVLTVLSLIVSLWLSVAIFNQFSATFQQYQNLGI